MSGGSYNYLCFKEFDGLVENQTDLQNMLDRLDGLGYAEDAAAETEEVIQIIKNAEVRINRRLGRLKELWRAMEWWDSCDTNEESFKKALDKYREEGSEKRRKTQ